MNRLFSKLLLLLYILILAPSAIASITPSTSADNSLWYSQKNEQPVVKLHFFWSETCPHCRKAHPLIDALGERFDWITVEDYLISETGNVDKLMAMGKRTGVEPKSVPYFAVCGEAIVGYNSHQVTGQYIIERLVDCYQKQGGKANIGDTLDDFLTLDNTPSEPLFAKCGDTSNVEDNASTCGMDSSIATEDTSVSTNTSKPHVQPVDIPLIGAVHPEQMSLPLLTVVLAGVDAFNPCAFFVLLFLLSIMVNAGSKKRMLLVGGIFVFFSGFIYFIFMSAWLNLFQLLGGGDGDIIITCAGVLALIAAGVNIKDYFYGRGDVSLSMSVENRGTLIKRMGKLSKTSSLPTMIIGSSVLAILANAYELLCTAGFPMIYTSVLSISNLDVMERYLYLIAYNVVYVIPLATIVIVFSMTLGKRKLTEKEGEKLKLMSGVMMLGLGSMLVINPMSLQNPVLSIGLIVGSIILTFIIVKLTPAKKDKSAG
ncbi:cytochrome C biosynthesis protein [Shewanella glacialimarina]|uniref:cytochrome C biosynthesis protein n=1 Tax=Shewanella glacialimarina TaxID=2590884 RepID=UPI001CF83338|nr:cytochrome C biosynthesis protein [Shewanella glacialimarina]UCX03266.1 cytochrome C biosynthesis protein [Shewanella glacialimarina]